jgi:hypothetical protein
MKAHRHRFRSVGVAGDAKTITESCACGERRDREATPLESQRWQAKFKRDEAATARMHRVYWDFNRRFRTGRHGEAWKWSGSGLIDRIEEWAKDHPRDVFVAGIDDTHHTSSILVLILHRDGARLWGTSAVMVAQNDGQPPAEFFTYPDHAAGMRLALEATEKLRPWDKIWAGAAKWLREREKRARPFGIRVR